MVRYSCANLLYLVTLDDIIADYELQLNWGLLVKIGDITGTAPETDVAGGA